MATIYNQRMFIPHSWVRLCAYIGHWRVKKATGALGRCLMLQRFEVVFHEGSVKKDTFDKKGTTSENKPVQGKCLFA